MAPDSDVGIQSFCQRYFVFGIWEGVNGKKNVFFRALPESPKPALPPDPNSGNLVLFFRKSKFKI